MTIILFVATAMFLTLGAPVGFSLTGATLLAVAVGSDYPHRDGRGPDAALDSEHGKDLARVVAGVRLPHTRYRRLECGLRERFGVARGDRVSILAHNSTDFFELMFACWKLGALFMPLNWRLTAYETAQVLAHGEPRIVACDEEFAGSLAGSDIPVLIRRPGSPGCEYEEMISSHAPEVRMSGLTLDDMNTLLYTSGTTGRPKGVIGTFGMTMNTVMHAALHADIDRTSRTLT